MMNTVRKSENLLPFPVISAAANGYIPSVPSQSAGTP